MLRIFFPIILLMFPLSVIAEWVCPALSGCKIEMDTGFCPKCIEVKEELPIIQEEKVVVEKKPIVKIPQKQKVSQSKDRKPITRERNWVGTLFECIVGCKEGVKYWDDGGNEFDKNLNLISKN